MAWAKVATNKPIASWLGRSRRNVCTIRGENCPIASWTTTIVIVRTKAANETMDVAIVPRIPKAASGPPVSHRGISPKSDARSIHTVAAERTIPARTHMTGMNHIPPRRREGRDTGPNYPTLSTADAALPKASA